LTSAGDWRREMVLALYNLMLALWVGGIFIYTFLVAPLIFKSFGRDAASAIVDKLFPFYFPYICVVVILAFVFFLISGLKKNARHKLTLVLLVISILIALFVNLGLYPEIKKTKQEIASFEKTPADSPARKRFSALHGISMTLNLVLLVDGISLIVIGSFRKNG
jgi:putative copper export protein